MWDDGCRLWDSTLWERGRCFSVPVFQWPRGLWHGNRRMPPPSRHGWELLAGQGNARQNPKHCSSKKNHEFILWVYIKGSPAVGSSPLDLSILHNPCEQYDLLIRQAQRDFWSNRATKQFIMHMLTSLLNIVPPVIILSNQGCSNSYVKRHSSKSFDKCKDSKLKLEFLRLFCMTPNACPKFYSYWDFYNPQSDTSSVMSRSHIMYQGEGSCTAEVVAVLLFATFFSLK